MSKCNSSTTILGAGISGISVSYHLDHKECIIFEKSGNIGGHAGSIRKSGFTLDHGPHVSFTKNSYVRDLFSKNTTEGYREFPVLIKNYFRGHWINHPAQAHLWQIPEPYRSRCAEEMIQTLNKTPTTPVKNYGDLLTNLFGRTFSETFPEAYTKKYWTVDASLLSTDWLGPRMAQLSKEQILEGLIPNRKQDIHYIQRVRYPIRGGFQAFFEKLTSNATIKLNHEVETIDLTNKELRFRNGTKHNFETLISTIPLPIFVTSCIQATNEVRMAAELLDCTELLIIDVFAPHEQLVEGTWFYVYDEEFLSTRIHCVERLSHENARDGWTGIQVEVYYSRYKALTDNPKDVAIRVADELCRMGFLEQDALDNNQCEISWRYSSYANVMFTHERENALETIWKWLEPYGLAREAEDLLHTSNCTGSIKRGSIAMAGRFAQWKYFWTDDCILRGKALSQTH